MLHRIPPLPAPTTPNARLLPDLLHLLSSEPHFPYSAPALGTLLAPLAWQNAHDAVHGPYKGPPRTARGEMPWSRGRYTRWAALDSLARASPAAPYSRRFVSLIGPYPGTPPRRQYPPRDWSVGVVDMDGLLQDALQEHGLRFWNSCEHLLFTDERAHARGHGLWQEVQKLPGGERGNVSEQVWRETADLRERKHRAQRALYGMLRDLAQLEPGKNEIEDIPPSRSLADLPLHHLPYITNLQTFSSRRNAPYRMYWNPQILGQRNAVRLYLPESTPWLHEQGGEGEEWGVRALQEDEVSTVSEASGGRYTEQYLGKGLPFTSAFRDGGNELLAWVTVRNDLSIMAPRLLSKPDGNMPQIEPLIKALITRTARRIYRSLRYTLPLPLPLPPTQHSPPPTLSLSPSAQLLATLTHLPLTATLPPSHPSLPLFTALGFLPLQGSGVADLALSWKRAKLLNPPSWDRALGGALHGAHRDPTRVAGFDPDAKLNSRRRGGVVDGEMQLWEEQAARTHAALNRRLPGGGEKSNQNPFSAPGSQPQAQEQEQAQEQKQEQKEEGEEEGGYDDGQRVYAFDVWQPVFGRGVWEKLFTPRESRYVRRLKRR
ncbi:hypothetical protein CALVIDRAFT_541275 [Calocera viscosa TUFC12733]|uniref:Uncharacterized protein n=1 Tax=Calocera viscosa (strain TUFC12733) TaxID=1330018 RepID=A0A167HXA8_CALVF|nr:hypothetical protein CALVIDRAFT_541275 [Calocera viscosa TUFC12733]